MDENGMGDGRGPDMGEVEARTRWAVAKIDGVWCVGMEGNLDFLPDSVLRINGSRCFGCGGSGKVHTPRDAVAHRWLEEVRSKRADAFMPGELVQHEIVSPYAAAKVWTTIVSIEPTTIKATVDGVPIEAQIITFTLSSKSGETRLTVSASMMMRKGYDAPTKQAQLRDAIAYQATLDAKGRPLRAAA